MGHSRDRAVGSRPCKMADQQLFSLDARMQRWPRPAGRHRQSKAPPPTKAGQPKHTGFDPMMMMGKTFTRPRGAKSLHAGTQRAPN